LKVFFERGAEDFGEVDVGFLGCKFGSIGELLGDTGVHVKVVGRAEKRHLTKQRGWLGVHWCMKA